MLVDKILKFLDSDRLDMSDPRFASLVKEGTNRASSIFLRVLSRRDDTGFTALRASKLGKCTRQNAYQTLGVEETDSMPTRASLIFTVGDIAEAVLAVLGRAAIAAYEPSWHFLEEIPRGELKFNGGIIEGMCDDILITDGGAFLIEYKSMSSYGFDRMERDQEIDNAFGYRTQHDLYREMYRPILREMYTLLFDVKRLPSLLIAYRKDSGNIQEIRTEESDPKVLTDARYTAQEIAKLVAGKPVRWEKFLRYPLVDDKQKGYKRVAVQCRYCPFMHRCWETDGGHKLEKVLRGKSNIWLVENGEH